MEEKIFTWVIRFLYMCLFCILISFPICCYQSNEQGKQKEIYLNNFLQNHGDVVRIIRIQDELKLELQGKSINTVRRVWFVCMFNDGYTVEIEQEHEGPTSLAPLVGDKWKLKTYRFSCSDTAKFYLYQLCERKP